MRGFLNEKAMSRQPVFTAACLLLAAVRMTGARMRETAMRALQIEWLANAVEPH
jgi:hypothetical protein